MAFSAGSVPLVTISSYYSGSLFGCLSTHPLYDYLFFCSIGKYSGPFSCWVPLFGTPSFHGTPFYDSYLLKDFLVFFFLWVIFFGPLDSTRTASFFGIGFDS